MTQNAAPRASSWRMFSLYWHITGRDFRDYHLLVDEHAGQVIEMTDNEMTDNIAERARKIGGSTLHSIGDIARHQRLEENDDKNVAPLKILSELREIDQTERRTWFLTEIVGES